MAKSPGGKSVGRVSIRVIPDTSKFREDLKKSLERIEQNTQLHVKPTLTQKDEAAFLKKVRDMVDKAKNNKVQIPVSAQTAAATAQLRFASRPRVVPFHVRVSRGSLIAAAATLARLSGARVASQWIEDLSRSFANLDKNLPKIGLATSSITTLGAGIFAALQGVISLGAGLATILPALYVAPGLLAGLAASAVIMGIGLSTANKELASLTPHMHELRDLIRDRFWAGARQPILNLVNGLMPQLRTAFKDASTEIGGFVGSLSNSFAKEFANGRFERIFRGIPESFKILSTGTDAFAGALVSLLQIASQYTPRLAQWFVDISVRFDKFLKATAEDGRMTKWIDDAIEAMRDLWRATTATGRIFGGLWKAAERAGSRGLDSFADSLERMSDVVNGPRFQAGLTGIFRGSLEAMRGFSVGIEGLGDLLYDLRHEVEYSLGTAGWIVGTFLDDITSALNTPVVASGLVKFMDGLRSGFESFGDRLPELSGPLGTLLSTMGELGRQLGPVLGASLAAFGKIIDPVLTTIRDDIIPALGPALTDAIDKLGPKLADLAENLAPILKGLGDLAVSILPVLTEAIGTFLDGVNNESTKPKREGLSGFGELFRGNSMGPAEFLSDMADGKSPMEGLKGLLRGDYGMMLADMAQFGADLSAGFSGVQVTFDEKTGAMSVSQAEWLTTMNENWDGFWSGLDSTFNTWNTELETGWNDLWNGIGENFGIFGEGVSNEWLNTLDKIGTWLDERGAGIDLAWHDMWAGMGVDIDTAWEDFKTTVKQGVLDAYLEIKKLPDKIEFAVRFASDWLFNTGKDIVQGLIDGIGSMWGPVGDEMARVSDRIVTSTKNRMEVASPSKRMKREVGRWIPLGIVDGIKSEQQTLDAAVADMVKVPKRPAFPPNFAGLGEGLKAAAAGITVEHLEVVNPVGETAPASVVTGLRALDMELGMG